MSPAHAHLLTNHLPVFGTLLAALLLGYSLLARKEEVKQASLALLVLLALATPLVFFSGHKAEDWAEHAGLSESRIEAHEEAGETAFILVEINGALALAILAARLMPRAAGLRGRAMWAQLLFSLAVICWLAWTGTTGGRIHHGEELGLTGNSHSVPHED